MSSDHISFSDESEDRLRKVTWKFWLMNAVLYLDHYEVEIRESRRHGYKTVASYDRLSPRGPTRIPESEVPYNAEVGARAVKQYLEDLQAQLRPALWSEYENRRKGT